MTLTAADRRQLQEHWLNFILLHGVNLTTWEENFVTRVSEKLVLNRRELSDAEHDKLEQIYAERTS